MISPNRLLVVGNDPAFVQVVLALVRRQNDRIPLTCRYDGVRQHVGPGTDGLVLLLANQPGDMPAVKGLLQELQLLHYNPRLVLIETPTAGIKNALDGFEGQLAERRFWNDGKDLISTLETHSNANQGLGFFDPARETVAERIARRLVAHTPSLAPMAEQLALAAAHDVTVLLDGETGTGKTFLARLIHDCSPRSGQRFLVVPCGALAPNLIESEFFGHAKGAFTGADAAKVGKFAAVGSGTLLLDEIDVLGLEHQANLLRVLESGEFESVGSNETQTCQARIIAATNLNLEEAADDGTFRRDLYYRLNVVSFHLPPLRERVHDIEPLVRGLVARFALKFRKDLVRIHPETIRVLEAFEWPGNIRQLENVIQQAVLLSIGPELVVKNLSPLVQNRCEPVYSPRSSAGTLMQTRETAERSTILRALEAAAYCRTRAASALGISRVTLYKKMRAYGLLARPAYPSARQPSSAAGA
jgi:two-component system response regulator HydG